MSYYSDDEFYPHYYRETPCVSCGNGRQDIGAIKTHASRRNSRTRPDILTQTEFFFTASSEEFRSINGRDYPENSSEIRVKLRLPHVSRAPSLVNEAGSLAAGCDSALRQLSYTAAISLSLFLSHSLALSLDAPQCWQRRRISSLEVPIIKNRLLINPSR